MRIGLDVRSLTCFGKSKVGWYQYTYNLIVNLLALDASHQYVLLSMLGHGKGFRGDEKIPGNLVRRFPGRILNALLERLSVPVELFTGRLDVFHGTCDFAPRTLRCKTVVTIHDLIPIRHPEFAPPHGAGSHRKSVSSSARSADVIIAVSHFTKAEILEVFGVPSERIRVIHNGFASSFGPMTDPEQIERTKQKHGVRGPYILFVGNIEPRKNIETLVRACVELRSATEYKYSLVIAGNKDWHFPVVWETVRKLRAEDSIIFTGTVDNDDLASLYRGAEVFAFPSLFEGFGIPVLEAMACGTPVIASNRTSIPEVAGGAALLVDPLDAVGMAEAMHRLLSDPALRRQCIERGFRRAKAFSWEKAARETFEVYRGVL
jgi:glycosyltransferase involved in cell wall biosynthesis